MVRAAGLDVASHIGEPDRVDKMPYVRGFLLRAAVGCVTLAAGILAGSVHHHLVQKRLAAQTAHATANVPAQAAPTSQNSATEESYPESKGLTASDIEWFIERHPAADLTRLWERLKIKNEFGTFGWGCVNCKAQSFNYNLDNDPDQEIVMRIEDESTNSYRYLIFKDHGYDDTPLLGHIDAYAKYRPSTNVVLLSGGKAWLVIESQAASGSGLAAYLHTIYQVSPRGVKPVVSYFSEISQHGGFDYPSRDIVAKPVSCEVRAGRVKATVSYTIEYSFYGDHKHRSLFTKHQTAVLIGGRTLDKTRLDTTASNITPHEFETVFNFDSMFEDAFLRYNRSELRAIAKGRDALKKQWLKEYLEMCENSRMKRELLSLLRNSLPKHLHLK